MLLTLFDYVINFVKPFDMYRIPRDAKWRFKPLLPVLSVYIPCRGY